MNDGPKPAVGHIPFADHRTCAEAAGTKVPAILAHFRPATRTVLIVVQGGDPAGVELSIPEARSIHRAIGQALRLADNVETPLTPMTDPEVLAG